MPRPSLLSAIVASSLALAAPGQAQDPLLGRWEGTLEGPQGKRAAVLNLQRDAAANYSGTITGLRSELPLSEIKVAGDQFTAEAVVESPQGKVTTKYTFTLQGGELRGKSETDFGGQTFAASYELKRAGASGAAAAPSAPPAGAAQAGRRQSPPQPTQRQSLEYFAGRWNYRWVGRESALTPGGVAEGSLVLEPLAQSPYLQGRLEGKAKWSPLGDKPLLGFEDSNKALVLLEQRNGIQMLGLGDWTSPIAIRFKVAPFQAGGKRLHLNRTLSIVAAHSFTLVEELSEDGGPVVRLGNAVFSRPSETAESSAKN